MFLNRKISPPPAENILKSSLLGCSSTWMLCKTDKQGMLLSQEGNVYHHKEDLLKATSAVRLCNNSPLTHYTEIIQHFATSLCWSTTHISPSCMTPLCNGVDVSLATGQLRTLHPWTEKYFISLQNQLGATRRIARTQGSRKPEEE